MGYLNNTTVTVDAILTNRGRQLLAKGGQWFNITQFALADDEVDYDNWNPAHQLGSNYYGQLIENMPVLEALPDETVQAKYKLITMAKGNSMIPLVKVNGSSTYSFTFSNNGEQQGVKPETVNLTNGNATFGYTAILSDSSVATLSVQQGLPTGVMAPTIPTYIGDASTESVSAVGMSFTLTAKQSPSQDKVATLVVIGNETGGRATCQITVNKSSQAVGVNTNIA